MAQKASHNHTPSGQPTEPPVQTGSDVISGTLVAAEAADSAQFVGAVAIVLRQLMRPVAALPLHQFMPLSDAFAQAKNRLELWSDELAVRELWQHARHRRLTVAARRILPDGTEQAFILKSAFWQYFAIETIHPSPDARLKAAVVRGRIWPASLGDGRWHFFVGRRRFDRCYSAAAPSEPAAQTPAPAPRNRGGRPDKYPHMRIVIEALTYIAINGQPDTLDGEGGLFEKLELRLKPAEIPKRGTLYKIFNPIWKGIEDERKRIEDERKKFKNKKKSDQ